MELLVCPRCGGTGFQRWGTLLASRNRRVQRYRCKKCSKVFHRSLRETPTQLVEGFLDIEASSLNADFGYMLSWAIKERDGPIFCDVMRRHSLTEERRLLRRLIRTVERFDMLYTYYGTRFDIPFIRARCLHHGIPFPHYMDLYHRDVYYIVKNRLKLHSSRLASAAALLGIRGKTLVEPRIWASAAFGDKRAFKEILEHNVGDVVVLERVYKRLEPFARPTFRSI